MPKENVKESNCNFTAFHNHPKIEIKILITSLALRSEDLNFRISDRLGVTLTYKLKNKKK